MSDAASASFDDASTPDGAPSPGEGGITAPTDAAIDSSEAAANPEAAAPDGATSPTGAIDPGLPAEPIIPAPHTVLRATKIAHGGVLSDEVTLDTARIQAAIDGCPSGQSVLLQGDPSNDAFLAGPLHLVPGVTLAIAAGTTLFASLNPRDFDVSSGSCGTSSADASNGCKPLVLVDGAGSGIMGDGRIDGRGGEPMTGAAGQTWWDAANAAKASGRRYSNPTLVEANGAQHFTLYRVSLVNSPKFHAVIGSQGFVVWGVTALAPAAPTNSAGATLTPRYATNTDGLVFAGASDGFVVYNRISVGGDQIGFKANSRGSIRNVTVAHNHLGAGRGMAIGVETYNGVTDVSVYDLSIDGSVAAGGIDPSDRNGIRIGSDPSVGGLVTGISYRDVCLRDIHNPININASSTGATGSSIADFAGITVSAFHSLAPSLSPSLTLRGYDASNRLGITLENVVIEGLTSSGVDAAHVDVTLGPGGVSFAPSGHDVTVHDSVVRAAEPVPCANKWVAF